MAKEKARTYAQLSAEGVKALGRFEDLIPLKKDWFPLMRTKYYRSARDNHWAPMLLGEPVPSAMLDAFAQEMNELSIKEAKEKRIKETLDLRPFIVAAEKTSSPGSNDRRQVHPWQAGLYKMLGWLQGQFFDTDAAYCDSVETLKEGVFDVVRSVGRTTAPNVASLSLENQLTEGEKAINWTASGFTDFIQGWWNVNEHVISTPPSGVSIVLPLTSAAATRFRNGEISDSDLNPQTDFEYPSRNLLILSCDDRPKQKGTSGSKAAWELFRCVSTQIAYFAHPELHSGPGLRLISFGGTPENARRLTKFGFTTAGGKMPRTGMLTMELSRPEKSHKDYLNQALAYKCMMHLIDIWQLVARIPSSPSQDPGGPNAPADP